MSAASASYAIADSPGRPRAALLGRGAAATVSAMIARRLADRCFLVPAAALSVGPAFLPASGAAAALDTVATGFAAFAAMSTAGSPPAVVLRSRAVRAPKEFRNRP
ncbi:hypothetical protein [Streptomyces sp. NPDC093071]|uniref:hypothetical protein n=1 Tax=Streptomyces sp. NPDC093071 TaxID=3366022 RepID=UPI00381861BD